MIDKLPGRIDFKGRMNAGKYVGGYVYGLVVTQHFPEERTKEVIRVVITHSRGNDKKIIYHCTRLDVNPVVSEAIVTDSASSIQSLSLKVVRRRNIEFSICMQY